jgi:hypothetical protein
MNNQMLLPLLLIAMPVIASVGAHTFVPVGATTITTAANSMRITTTSRHAATVSRLLTLSEPSPRTRKPDQESHHGA